MKIVTHYDPKPIPDRRFDWTAYDGDTYDGPGRPVGYGTTERDAIDDLVAQIEDAMSLRQNMMPLPTTPDK